MEHSEIVDGLTPSQRESYEVVIGQPDLLLSPMASIDLLKGCIDLGKQAARKVKGKHVFIVLGDTGAGKSTFINYVGGCTMECVRASAMDICGLGWVYRTRDRAIMPIGHGKVSKTFIPHVATDINGFTWVDCPGWVDSRGPEIDIANAVNIRNVLRNARSVRVIVLLSYQGISSARCSTLKNMLENCRQLFTDDSNLLKEKESILIGISRNEGNDLCDLQKYLCEGHGTPDKMKEFRNKLFFFDPLDGEGPHYKLSGGGWRRYQILSELRRLKPIENPDRIFQTNLSPVNALRLRDMCNEMMRRCIDAMEDPTTGVTKDRKMKEATEMYSTFETLADGLNHARVNNMYNDLRESISTYYRDIGKEARRKSQECIGNGISDEDAIKKSHQEVRDLVNVLQKGQDNFPFLEDEIDLEALHREILANKTSHAKIISQAEALEIANQKVADLEAQTLDLQPEEKQIPNLGIAPTLNNIGDERYVYIKSIRGHWLSAAKRETYCLAASANEADRTLFKMVTRTLHGKKVVKLSIAYHPYMRLNTYLYAAWTGSAKFTCASSHDDQHWTTSDGTKPKGPIDDCDYRLETECMFRDCHNYRYMTVNTHTRVGPGYDDEPKMWVEVISTSELPNSSAYCYKFTIHACEEEDVPF